MINVKKNIIAPTRMTVTIIRTKLIKQIQIGTTIRTLRKHIMEQIRTILMNTQEIPMK